MFQSLSSLTTKVMTLSLLLFSSNSVLGQVEAKNIKSTRFEFIENKGQLPDKEGFAKILFKATSSNSHLYITEKGITYTIAESEEYLDAYTGQFKYKDKLSIKYHKVDIDFIDGEISKNNIEGLDQRETEYNYYYSHCPEGIVGVKSYNGVIIKNLYPGIDWKISENGDLGLKSEFMIHAGADFNSIKMRYVGADKISIENGKLVIKTSLGNIIETGIFSYFTENNEEIKTEYIINEDVVSFRIDQDVNNKSFIIDPPLVWGTHQGDAANQGFVDMVNSPNGDVYVVGYTYGTIGTYYMSAGAGSYFVSANSGFYDGCIFRYDNLGRKKWGTYYGGSADDVLVGVDFNSNTNTISVVGYTLSPNFPVSATPFQGANGGLQDACFMVFQLNGIRNYSTYYGGTGTDFAIQTVCNARGESYIVGRTSSANFPTSAGAPQTVYGGGAFDAFLVGFNNLNARVLSTYHGGNSSDIGLCIDHGDNVNSVGVFHLYIGGSTTGGTFPIIGNLTMFQTAYGGGTSDGFIAKYNISNLSSVSLNWSAYHGGSASDTTRCIVFVNNHAIYFADQTSSNNLAFCSPQLSYKGSTDAYYYLINDIVWPDFDLGGYLGSSGQDIPWRMRWDNVATPAGFYLVGQTKNGTTNFAPLVSSGPACYYNQLAYGNGVYDGFIVRGNNCTINWSTFWGGDDQDWLMTCSVDNNNCFWAGGELFSASVGVPSERFDPGSGAYFQAAPVGSHEQGIAKFCDCPRADAGPDKTSCCASSLVATLGVNSHPCFTYSWSPATNLSSAFVSNPTVTFNSAATITYTLTVTNASANCVSTDNVVVSLSQTCCRTASQVNLEEGKLVSVYPNPSNNGQFNLQVSDSIGLNRQIFIYDNLGRVVINQTVSSDNNLYNIDLSSLSKGTYILRFVTAENSYIFQLTKTE
jgi:Secretion system C-terminal sorting domain